MLKFTWHRSTFVAGRLIRSCLNSEFITVCNKYLEISWSWSLFTIYSETLTFTLYLGGLLLTTLSQITPIVKNWNFHRNGDESCLLMTVVALFNVIESAAVIFFYVRSVTLSDRLHNVSLNGTTLKWLYLAKRVLWLQKKLQFVVLKYI